MSHPLLGDPASMSALAATLRHTALQLRADGERLELSLEDASPGWSGPTAVVSRRRAAALVCAVGTIARALDDCGGSLQLAATGLADSIARLRALEEEAAAAGLAVRDGSVERSWGITGVADPSAAVDGDRLITGLQERVHQTVTSLGRHRTRLTADCESASRLLAETGAVLRG